MNENYDDWLSDDDSRIEPPPKTRGRKESTQREQELSTWRKLHSLRVKELSDSEATVIFCGITIVVVAISTSAICACNASKWNWMYDWLKVVVSVSSFFLSGFVMYLIFHVCIHILALFRYPYPLPKLTFKQTYKFVK